MNRLLSAAALVLVSASAFAVFAPVPAGGRDLTRIPADPAAREMELAALPVTLAKAIEAASKDGGAVASAAYNGTGQIELIVYQGGAENSVVVDGKSGAVISKNALPRFAGDPVTGEGTTSATGLRHYDLKVGEGAEATKTSKVSVHYTGWLVDGSKFDSSVDRGQPFEFSLTGGVINGWLEGVNGMRVGSKRKLVIPANLGYGARGAGGAIPPNAVLVFDVELLGVK